MESDKLISRIAELEAALNWCIEEGGWRLFHYAANVPDVFDTSDIHNVIIRPTMPMNATDQPPQLSQD